MKHELVGVLKGADSDTHAVVVRLCETKVGLIFNSEKEAIKAKYAVYLGKPYGMRRFTSLGDVELRKTGLFERIFLDDCNCLEFTPLDTGHIAIAHKWKLDAPRTIPDLTHIDSADLMKFINEELGITDINTNNTVVGFKVVS